jgi:hypothetical protein
MIRAALCYVFGHQIGWLVLGSKQRAGCTRCGTTFRMGSWADVNRTYESERSMMRRRPFL